MRGVKLGEMEMRIISQTRCTAAFDWMFEARGAIAKTTSAKSPSSSAKSLDYQTVMLPLITPLPLLLLLLLPLVLSYNIIPNEDNFGATLINLNVTSLIQQHNLSPDFDPSNISPSLQHLISQIKTDLHTHRFLHFPNQDHLPWESQLTFLQLFGTAYDESSHVNRLPWVGEKDPRVAVFSNNPKHGLTGVGVEGFHR